MKIETRVSRKIVAGFLLALLLLMGIGVESYRSTRAFVESADIVNRTHEIMSALQMTLADLVSAESEARGYIISEDARHLNSYRNAIGDVKHDLQTLRREILDPDILELVDQLDGLTQARLERLRLTVETRRLEGLEAVVEAAGVGKKLMDELRSVAAEIEQREQKLLDERDRKAQERAARTLLVVLLGSVLAVALAAASTVVLRADLAHRERLEKELLETREREQRRIGQDLHDGVCQQLTGISLLSRSLEQKLSVRTLPETGDAAQITQLINASIEQTRRVTRGLHPVPDDPTGLMLALQELAEGADQTGAVSCRFDCPTPVPVPDQIAATHLYRIAQEALQNALRHAAAKTIAIGLQLDEQAIRLTIRDDGVGLPPHRTGRGLGLEIMNYRANAIGGSFEARRGEDGGTIIACTLPRSSLN
jgi:signal transduction histidine kinase